MPIPVTSGDQPFSLEDAWVYPFSAGVPGTGIDIPGIVEITGEPQNTVVEHRGDGTVIAKVATFDSVDITLTVGVWNLAAMQALVGGTIPATVGTTPNQIRKIIHKSTDAPADCGIQAQTHSRSADGGGTRVVYPRCQPQNIPSYGLQDQEFNDLEITMSGVANASSEMVAAMQFETYTPLTSTWTALTP